MASLDLSVQEIYTYCNVALYFLLDTIVLIVLVYRILERMHGYELLASFS